MPIMKTLICKRMIIGFMYSNKHCGSGMVHCSTTNFSVEERRAMRMKVAALNVVGGGHGREER